MREKIKVICMGDSITEGYGIDRAPDGPYPAQLQKLLGTAYQVHNQGVSCTCTVNRKLDEVTVGQPYMLEEKYQEALALKGDIYVILLGTNDAQDGYHDEAGAIDRYHNVYAFREFFIEDYLKIVREIQNTNPEAKILMGKPVPVMKSIWKKHRQSYLETILPEYDKIKTEEPSLILVGLQEEFMKYTKEDRVKLYQADGVHPNEKGAGVIAEKIGKTIAEL